jgi:hypothetical protein
LDVLKGTVQRVYDTGRGPRVVVAVELPDADGSTVEDVSVTLPADAVERWQGTPTEEEQPGHWAHGYAYERNLRAAVEDVIDQLYPNTQVSVLGERQDRGVDFTVRLHGINDDRVIVGVAKYVESRQKTLPGKAVLEVLRYAQLRTIPIVLFSNASLLKSARDVIQEVHVENFRFIRWRGSVDNEKLAVELRRLIESIRG